MKHKQPEKPDKPMAAQAPEKEKSLGRDLKLIGELPARTQELSALMDASEKTTGTERVAVTRRIRDKSK